MTVFYHETTDCRDQTARSGFVRAIVRTLLCATVLSVGCKKSPNAVIGFAYLTRQPNLVRVAQATLDEQAGGTGWSNIRFVTIADSIHIDGPAAHVRHAMRLSEREGMVGVVGHNNSTMSLLVAPIYNEAGIVQLVPTGTNPRLADAGEWTFSLAPTDSVVGAFMGQFVVEHLRARHVTVFHIGNLYGASLRDGVVSDLQRRGVKAIDIVPFGVGAPCPPLASKSEIVRNVTPLGDRVPDVVVVIGGQGPSACLAGLLHESHPDLSIVLGDAVGDLDALRQAAGPAASRLYATTGWHPDTTDTAVVTFLERFRRIVGRSPRPGEAKAFDALMLLATAIEAVGTDAADVRAYMADLGDKTPPYHGVTGRVSFERPGRHSLTMIRVHDGTPVLFALRRKLTSR